MVLPFFMPCDGTSDAAVDQVALHPDGRQRPGRTDIFTGTAADAAFRVHGGQLELARPHKADGPGGTAPLAGRTGHLVPADDAQIPVNHGPAHLDGALFLQAHWH